MHLPRFFKSLLDPRIRYLLLAILLILFAAYLIVTDTFHLITPARHAVPIHIHADEAAAVAAAALERMREEEQEEVAIEAAEAGAEDVDKEAMTNDSGDSSSSSSDIRHDADSLLESASLSADASRDLAIDTLSALAIEGKRQQLRAATRDYQHTSPFPTVIAADTLDPLPADMRIAQLPPHPDIEVNAADIAALHSLRVVHVTMSNDGWLPPTDTDRDIPSHSAALSSQKGWCNSISGTNAHPRIEEECSLSIETALFQCMLLQDALKRSLCQAVTCMDGNENAAAATRQTGDSIASSTSSGRYCQARSSADADQRRRSSLQFAGSTLKLRWLSYAALLPIHKRALSLFLHHAWRKRRTIYADSLVIVFSKADTRVGAESEGVSYTEATAQHANVSPASIYQPWYIHLLTTFGVKVVLLPKTEAVVDNHDTPATSAGSTNTHASSHELQHAARLQAKQLRMDGMVFVKHAKYLLKQTAIEEMKT